MNTVTKFKALLKAKSNNEVDSILKKCTLDEMKKFALAFKLDIEEISRSYCFQLEIGLVNEIIGTLDSRRSYKKLARKYGKKAA